MPEDNAIAALASEGIDVLGPIGPQYDEILTPEALRFVASLQRTFGARREELLARRVEAQKKIDSGVLPDFLPETEEIRKSDWKVAPIPKGLEDRRVEITGPVERKMVINALNSGASVFLADFEDANSPTWSNCIEGQLNLRDAIDGTIEYRAPETGKEYRLNEKTAILFVRPRGWHLLEKHLLVDGKPCSGSLFDFGLNFFHCGRRLLAKGAWPCYYLPKLEHHLEARLWNDVFVKAQKDLGIPNGTIRATVLIETIMGAFQMDEILWELRDHSAGLNCGRWDYIFSFIKKLGRLPGFLLPDRGLVTMEKHFLASYVTLLIRTCHRRGIHGMGGMAAQIPIKNDPAANEAALAKVKADKLREVTAGHDGTWVAHPGLVPIAMEIFDAHMPQPNQIATAMPTATITAKDLLTVPEGPVTEKGLRQNLNVGILYLEAWLRGNGCVPLYNLMEDAATSEISRTQVWQWLKNRVTLADGRTLTPELYGQVFDEEVGAVRARLAEEGVGAGRYELAAQLFDRMIRSEELPEFLTLSAYEELMKLGA
ncbi:MAG TPA: malate synthase A [Thermoanaerobaculia bacterium]|nr:malate synthase A [Thermoanaerobaculia bacterium]